LGDDPASTRYIRTVPKLGYQFIAPAEAIAPTEKVDESSTNGLSPAQRDSWRMPVSALVLLLLVAMAFVAGYQVRATVRGRSLPIIAVARFDNETGDPSLTAFADALTDDVVAQLTNTGHGQISVIGNAQILRVPRAQRDLLVIGAQLKAKYVVLGQVMPAGDQTRILAHLIRLPEQTHLWVARVDLPRIEPGTNDGNPADKISGAFLPRLAADVRSGYSSPGLGR
jgi:TolB-like protein